MSGGQISSFTKHKKYIVAEGLEVSVHTEVILAKENNTCHLWKKNNKMVNRLEVVGLQLYLLFVSSQQFGVQSVLQLTWSLGRRKTGMEQEQPSVSSSCLEGLQSGPDSWLQ